MWSRYTKTFVFRDCFDKDIVKSNAASINKMLSEVNGTLITTDILSAGIAYSFEAQQNDEDGEWQLGFYNKGKSVASVFISDFKEIHLCFEIEEEVETGKMVIDYCSVKGFKEYQF